MLITCNTFLYCVLYSKVRYFNIINLGLIFLFFNLLIDIAFYDMKNKIIKNKSNIFLLLLSISLHILRYQNLRLLINKIIIVSIIFLLLVYIRKLLKNNIGGGDIKMLCSIFVYLSLNEIITMIYILSFTSLIFALYLLLIKKKNKDYKFSYGEFISLSTIITILIYGGN